MKEGRRVRSLCTGSLQEENKLEKQTEKVKKEKVGSLCTDSTESEAEKVNNEKERRRVGSLCTDSSQEEDKLLKAAEIEAKSILILKYPRNANFRVSMDGGDLNLSLNH